MKTTKYILFALAIFGLATSCHDSGDWDVPSTGEIISAYGNQNIQPTNVKTIAELKALYSNEINNNSLKQVTKPLQIVGLVNGNDEGGNIYNAIYVQDNTGAIAISVGQGGLAGPFAVGQPVIIELEGLYVGGYGKQAQIGTTYTNPNKEGATPQVGRMSRYFWQNHYRLLLPTDELAAGMSVAPIEVKWNFNTLDIAADCAKLITLKGVELAEADGTAVFAPNDGSVSLTANCANRIISGLSNVVLRTSTYADFANKPMPTGRVDITGVATRYNDTWQLLMRTDKDIVESSTEPAPVATPAGSGTQADPYNVQGIINATKSLAKGSTTDKEYAKGYVVGAPSFNSKYSSLSYYISDDKEGNLNSFYVYSGQGLNKSSFSSADDLKAGDEVVVCGKVTNYNGTIEFQSQNYLVSLNGKTK